MGGSSSEEPTCQCRRPSRPQVQFLGQKDSLEDGMATHSSVLAWKIPWTEAGGLRSTVFHRVVHNWSHWARVHTHQGQFQHGWFRCLETAPASIHLHLHQPSPGTFLRRTIYRPQSDPTSVASLVQQKALCPKPLFKFCPKYLTFCLKKIKKTCFS